MKNKIISLVLVLILLFSGAFSLISSTQENIPTVVVHGINSKPLVKFNEDGTVTTIFPPNESILKTSFSKMLDQVKKSALSFDLSKEQFGNLVIDTLGDILGDLACDSDGNVSPDTGINYDNMQLHYDNSCRGYVFSYDWRLSPFELASQLNTYIDSVLAETGAEKVNIHAFSMGGAVTMTYLYEHGFGKVSGLVMDSSAFLGTGVAGEAFTKKLDISEEGWSEYVFDLLTPGENRNLVDMIVQALYKSCALKGVTDLAMDFINEYQDKLYDELLSNIFINSTGLWSLIPNAFYDEARSLYLMDDAHSNIRAITDEYQYQVQAHALDMIDQGIAKGLKFGIISKYNMQNTPIVPSKIGQGDLVIDTVYTSAGATCANLGDILPEGYTGLNGETKYISPDSMIDASTCRYPEYTWFIREMPHFDFFSEDITNLVHYILDSENQVTVFDNENYPQYMKYNKADRTLSALSVSDPESFQELNLFEILFRLFQYLINSLVKA